MNITPVSNTYNNKTAFTAAPKLNPGVISKSNAFMHEARTKYAQAKENFIENCIIKPVLQPAMNSKFMGKFADWSANIENLPSHMSTAGSIVTTYFYANRTKKTLNQDDEQRKRAKVLRLNQWLVTGVSTALGYGTNGLLNKVSKDLGYKFREANQGHPKLSTRMKGFDIAKQLAIFTMMYRYVAPVLVTPVASKGFKLWEDYKNKKAEKSQVAQTVQMQPKTTQQVSNIKKSA